MRRFFYFGTLRKIAVIQSLRKADYGGASLKFAILDILFLFKSNRPKDSNSSKTHLVGVYIILEK